MRPKRGVKRKSETRLDGSSDSSGLFVGDKPNRAKKRSTRGQSLSRLNDAGEDGGQNSSRNFQQWTEWLENLSKDEAQKSTEFLAAFQKKVDRQKDHIQAYLGQSGVNLEKKVAAITATLRQVTTTETSPSTSGGGDHHPTDSTRDSSVLFQQARALIADGYALLKSFDDKDKRLETRLLDQPIEVWKKDKENVEEILNCGREYFEDVTERNLGASGLHLGNDAKPRDTEQEQIGFDMARKSRETLKGETWNMAANLQLKNYARVADSIASQAEQDRLYAMQRSTQ